MTPSRVARSQSSPTRTPPSEPVAGPPSPVPTPEVSTVPVRVQQADIAIAHDYLTQRGGAERVVLSLTRAFPGAAVHTSFYDPDDTYPSSRDVDIRTAADQPGRRRCATTTGWPCRSSPSTFSRVKVDADVVVCSSSGWAHGVRATGRKLVYCHAPGPLALPARRLHGAQSSSLTARDVAPATVRCWRAGTRSAAETADLYLVELEPHTAASCGRPTASTAEVLHPPHSIGPDGVQDRIERDRARASSSTSPGCCPTRTSSWRSRRSPSSPRAAGRGRPRPDEERLRSLAGPNVTFVPEVTDEQLRWVYANARGPAGVRHRGLRPLPGRGGLLRHPLDRARASAATSTRSSTA